VNKPEMEIWGRVKVLKIYYCGDGSNLAGKNALLKMDLICMGRAKALAEL